VIGSFTKAEEQALFGGGKASDIAAGKRLRDRQQAE